MKTAGVAQLKARLSEFLAAVKAGEEVQVTERGRPVARLVPLAGPEEEDAALLELERAGLIRRPLEPLNGLPEPVGRDPSGSVRAALAAEREESW